MSKEYWTRLASGRRVFVIAGEICKNGEVTGVHLDVMDGDGPEAKPIPPEDLAGDWLQLEETAREYLSQPLERSGEDEYLMEGA